MADFVWPDWLPTAPELPPPPVDPHRIEGLANRFIAASQDALHTGPDALVGKSGADAIEAAPAVAEQLSGLRDATPMANHIVGADRTQNTTTPCKSFGTRTTTILRK